MRFAARMFLSDARPEPIAPGSLSRSINDPLVWQYGCLDRTQNRPLIPIFHIVV
jgi:hypothetical protein